MPKPGAKITVIGLVPISSLPGVGIKHVFHVWLNRKFILKRRAWTRLAMADIPIKLEEEGLVWARGWDTPEARALLTAVALG